MEHWCAVFYKHAITYQEIKYAKPKHFEGDAHVSVIIKPIEHFHAQAENNNDETSLVEYKKRVRHL